MRDHSMGYSGVDRRFEQRRKNPDRRAEIRYEPKKEPRRHGNGRRQGELMDVWDIKRS